MEEVDESSAGGSDGAAARGSAHVYAGAAAAASVYCTSWPASAAEAESEAAGSVWPCSAIHRCISSSGSWY